MHSNKKFFFHLVFSLIFCLTLVPQGWAAYLTVKKDAQCDTITTGDPYYCKIQDAIDAASPYDTICIKAKDDGSPYLETITIDKKLRIIGKTKNGANAWSPDQKGSMSGAPIIRSITSTKPIIQIKSSAVEMIGLNVSSVLTPVSCTALYGNIGYITITYCTYNLDRSTTKDDIGIGIDDGNSVNNLSISYCKFIGQHTATSNWFSVGAGSSATGDGGKANGVTLSNNEIQNSIMALRLDGDIKNINISNNIFKNNWDAGKFIRGTSFYGYILIDEPNEQSSKFIQGITITNNTFKNSEGSAPYETSLFITKNIEEADAGDWNNLALHFNNLEQDKDPLSDLPVVGFEDYTVSAISSSITATANYWYNAPNAPTTASEKVAYQPWIKYAGVSSGAYTELAAIDTIQEITGTQMLKSNMYLQVKTSGGAATLIPTKYTGNPTATNNTVSGKTGIAFFDLGVKSGLENIKAITATFYAPSGCTLDSDNPLYWYNGSNWIACPSKMWKKGSRSSVTITTQDVSGTYITHTFGPTLTAYITCTADFVTAKSWYVTPTINNLTRTNINTTAPRGFFALVGTGGSATTSSSTTTTTSGSGGGATSTSSTTTSVTPTTSTTSVKTTTTTTTVKPTTTTTTTIPPKLTVSPSSLTFDDNDTAKQISISNTGSGTLTWQINDNATTYTGDAEGWIFTASPRSGSVTNTPQSVTILVSRSGVPSGTHTATLPILSNGGSKNLSVSMDVGQSELPLPLVSTRLLIFNTTDTNKTFTIRNLSSGSVTWEIDDIIYNRSRGWLSVTPNIGYTRTETDTVTVTVDREGAGKGFYSAVIPVRTNAGTVNVNVLMLVQEGPVTKVQPSMLLFLSKKDTVKGFSIANTGSGTMTWSIGTPEYKGGSGWIASITPMAGTINAGDSPAVISVTVNREGLISGLYRADIPITSNGGDRKVIVLLLVMPF